ncbi:type II toxin-antitoxin system mRNA interferase toxin, RelE/StbE family [Pseudomonas sp. Hp2]|uniref:type II toxin-antitoxin system mRNA interferase toxin, RelE/StbE family n=1 Tax=Pseudomonas sp. Hp2 TaxID=701189 RepID=UPI003556063D
MVSRAGIVSWPPITGSLLPVEKSDYFRADVVMARESGFKKDLYEMGHLVEGIRRNLPLPPDYKTHPLRGDWTGWLDSHLRPDFLLIWRYHNSNGQKIVQLARCGPHSWVF